MQILNYQILKHPMNWIVLFFMVLLFGIGLHIVLDFYAVAPKTPNSTT